MSQNQICATCRHVIGGVYGHRCRLTRLDRPMGPPHDAASYYGAVDSHDWCGEHTPRVDAPTSHNEGPSAGTVARALDAEVAIGEATRKESSDAR